MPYTAKTAPSAVKKLPGHARRIFLASFSSANKFYEGDEAKSHAVAWSAVKKKYTKKGENWVANQNAGSSEGTMIKLLEDLRYFYTSLKQGATDPEMVDLTAVNGILDEVSANPSTDGYRLKELDQKFIAAIGFDIRQHYGYDGEGSVSAEHISSFPGSLQHQIRCVCAALREDDEKQMYLGDWGTVLACYPDKVITCAIDAYDETDKDYWSIDYTFDADSGKVTFGDATPVDVRTVVVPAGPDDDDEGQGAGDVTQDGLMKTDGGKQFGKEAYLIIGDPKLPSTWKVRVQEEPGKITVPQLGRAYAALTKGFRGNKVQANADAVKSALGKLKGLYAKEGAPFPGGDSKKQDDNRDTMIVVLQNNNDPEWVLQGGDPPGGDEELTQTASCELKQEGFDESTGILKVSGVATTANVVNSKGQVYPLEVWQDNLPRLNRLLQGGKLVGESEHPTDGRASLDRTCIKFTKLWMDGNQAKFEAEILPTEPHGKNLQTLIQNGVSVDISSRGKGTTKTEVWQGTPNVAVVQRGFRCDAFDGVVAGASPGSTITGWQVQSLEQTANKEDGMLTAEQQAQFDAKMAALDAKMAALDAKNITQDDTAEKDKEAVAKLEQATANDSHVARLEAAAAKMETGLIRGRKLELIQEASQKWGPAWTNMYSRRLDNCGAKTVEELEQHSAKAVEDITDLVATAPKFPGVGFSVEKDRGDRGFKSINQMFNALTEGLADEPPLHGMDHFLQHDADGKPIVPGHVQTPKRQVMKMLQNTAKHVDGMWNGPAQAAALLKLSQGYRAEEVQDFLNQELSPSQLNQTIADGTTAVGAGGAPSSAIFIFPLVRRVFPQLIATELASVQPMDRPDGKIFFLDAYRKDTGVNSVDPAGNTITDRMRIDRSDSFSDSYANDPGETMTANFLQMRLAGVTVTAQTKKLYAQWSIEEMQDLRAYHGLDAALELVGSLSREIALEWNQIVLKELVNGATAGNRNFGTTAPSGYTQKEWDEYITRYIDALSSDIFSKRHGDITHMIAGPSAWVKLAATFRVGTDPRSGPEPEQYAGITLTPFMAGTVPNLKTYKTSFWTGTNTNTILVLRRGSDWSDTPYVWAPYIDYVSPTLTTPDVFTQKQGLMSRVAHQVVVGEAIGTLSIQQGVTGVAL